MSSTIMDYFDWRGDLSFNASPLCEVDTYILAKIGCPNFIGIIPEATESVSIQEAVSAYFTQRDPEGTQLGATASPFILPVVRRLPETVRFRDLQLSGYRRTVNPEITEQFSALTVTLPDHTHYITFRGTDDTMIGWKEDLMMAVQESVQAQKDAAEYLEWAAANYDGPLVVAGHSKGGNLAVYAASHVSPEAQDRISEVYCFDGPGFLPSFYLEEGYLRIRDKLRLYMPQNAIVGTFLVQDKEAVILRCERSLIAAHDGFVWEVKGPSFVHTDSLSRTSIVLDNAVDSVLENMTPEERLSFVEEFFSALTSTGAENVADLTENRFRQALDIVREMRGNHVVSGFFGQILGETARTVKSDAKHRLHL